MSDHWHYSSDIHGGAEQHHRHYDLEREDDRLQGGLREAMAQVALLRREMQEQLDVAFGRIQELEDTMREHQMAVPHPEMTP